MPEDNMHLEAPGRNWLTIADVEGEARILDTDLAARLGFASPIDIRKLVRRHADALGRMGVLATVAKTSSAGGRPGTDYYLNRKQAIFITAKSETPDATDITIEIIEWFDAYERGQIGATPRIDVRDPSQLSQIAIQLIEVNKELEARAERAEKQVESAKPKTQFYDKYANAEGLYNLQSAARVLRQGPNRFIAWLKQGYLFYQGGALVPKVQYREMGVFEVKANIVDDKARYQTFVTPKGILYFAKKLGVA